MKKIANRQLTIKDLTPMNRCGFQGIDDEWYANGDYELFIKLDQHHYHVKIAKTAPKTRILMIYLSLRAYNARDIKVYQVKSEGVSIKDFKQLAVEKINEYHNSEKCDSDIDAWKKANGRKVFNSDFEYIGMEYCGLYSEKGEFDYYNEDFPKITYGTYYRRFEDSVEITNISPGTRITTWSLNKELYNKLK